MRSIFLLGMLFFGFAIPVSQAQTPPCEVLTNATGNQRANGSRVCLKLTLTDGRVDFDRTQSVFRPSDEFKSRLNIPGGRPNMSLAQAEENLFIQLRKVFARMEKPYRLALSDEEKALDDKGQLTDEFTARVRAATKPWVEYLSLFNDWVETEAKPQGVGEIFPEAEATNIGGLIYPLATADQTTALFIYGINDYDAETGVIRFAVADPINDWSGTDPPQVQLLLPGVSDLAKREARLKRLREILEPLRGTPRCLDCITARLNAFYQRLGLKPNLIFDNRGSSPLIIKVIESSRIVGISWLSLEDDDIDKVMYSLLTRAAFRSFLKNRTEITSQKSFDYIKRTGRPGPYVNETRLQIQQLLLNQIGYTVSFAFALNKDVPETSNYNLTIQKTSEAAADNPASDDRQNETPDSAPATANPEGVVTPHEQEKENATEFVPETKPTPENGKKETDKKRYLGGGLEYQPGQGVRFFGLGQISRFPFLPDSLNTFSAKAGGQGTAGALGAINYFGDYLFFNTLHRRLSAQLTVSSDVEANRNLNGSPMDERRRQGVARVEFEPFRDWSGSLLRFFAEGRRATVILQDDDQVEMKQNLTTLEAGGLYLFESSEVENPRRIRLEPKIRMGLGVSGGEPRFNKWLTTGNFHQMLPGRFEADISGRFELASRSTPRFELPSLGGADVIRGFRRDDGLGRKLWSLQNELWVPLPVGDETSQGLKEMLRQKVKLATFVDAAGLYQAVNTTSGTRTSTGLGLRLIYNPIIFKIDYGYGFGTAATGGSRGKLHFSIASNLPF